VPRLGIVLAEDRKSAIGRVVLDPRRLLAATRPIDVGTLPDPLDTVAAHGQVREPRIPLPEIPAVPVVPDGEGKRGVAWPARELVATLRWQLGEFDPVAPWRRTGRHRRRAVAR
jgi:hypothetical protein